MEFKFFFITISKISIWLDHRDNKISKAAHLVLLKEGKNYPKKALKPTLAEDVTSNTKYEIYGNLGSRVV